MNATGQRAKEIFVELVGHVPSEQWDEQLAQACGDDANLLRRVRALLHAHRDPDSFLNQPSFAPDPQPTSNQLPVEVSGTTIGPYKLLQQIGEGGMGVVYMAEQSAPVERRVALKIIKPGMDTRQVIARFEAERQALAMMDHPNIAKVFDAGATDSGHPYFVMELVRGIPITKYCDEHHLTLKQRLELFLPVCQAVQHAHQKGIIHRDLKPTNVLVAQYDDKPVPKVIDFGVAKAAQKLTERTMFTEFGQVVGTLEYMSPEQARLNQLDIDTRSDIYSLGVLLYELLTGCTPFDGKRLRSAAFDEMLRIIREEEPPKPSTRLSSADTLPSIAASRSVEPARLGRSLRGELDWIVMKALEKDRNRRYETANGFAQDLQHYLADEAVQACPPSARYRLSKFARRNKQILATAGFIALAMLVTLVTLAVSNVIISQERDAKTIALADRETALIQAQANKEAADKQRQRAEDNLQMSFDALDQILVNPADKRLVISDQERSRLLAVNPERLQVELEIIEKGAEFYAQFAKRNSDDPSAQLKAAAAHEWLACFQHQMGQQEKSLQTYRQGLRFLESSTLAQLEDPAYLQTKADLYLDMYLPLFAMKRFEEAEEVTRRALALYQRLPATGGPDDVFSRWRCNMYFGDLASQAGRELEAEQAYRTARAVCDDALQVLPGDSDIHYYKAMAGESLGKIYAKAGRPDEAIAVWEAVVKEWARLAKDTGEPECRWHLAVSLEEVGLLHYKAARYQEADRVFADALPIWEKLGTETNLPDHRYHLGLNREQAGLTLQKMNRLPDAAMAFQASIAIWEKLVAEFNQPDHRGHLAFCQAALKEVEQGQARAGHRKAIESDP